MRDCLTPLDLTVRSQGLRRKVADVQNPVWKRVVGLSSRGLALTAGSGLLYSHPGGIGQQVDACKFGVQLHLRSRLEGRRE